jgi:hypothetical protein
MAASAAGRAGAQAFHPEHAPVGVAQDAEMGAIFARDVGPDPEIGDFLAAPSGGPETIARPLPAQRPWKRRLRHVDIYSYS